MEPTSSPNDVFKFVNTRPFQKITEPDVIISFTTYDFYRNISPTDLQAIENDESLLYTELMADLSSATPREAMESTVADFRINSSFYWSTLAEIQSAFPELSSVQDYLIEVNYKDTSINFKSEVENNLISSTISNYLSATDYLELKLRLWDNLMAEVILPENYELRNLITNYLRILHLFETIVASSSPIESNRLFRKIVLATPVLPKPVFPLERIENDIDENETHIDTDTTEVDDALAAIEEMEAAIEEVKDALELQNLNTSIDSQSDNDTLRENFNKTTSEPQRETPSAVTPDDPMLLTDDTVQALSQETQQLLSDFDLGNRLTRIDAVINRLRKEIDRKTKIVFKNKRGSEKTASIGGSIIALSHYCDELLRLEEQRNPCDPFYGTTIPSGSGNIKPVGEADLLVVRQQLLKYKVGEIAHVENILQTESKEREHRKLNRVEETTLVETETTTETLEDTQSTERFSMQKETSQVINEMQQNQSSSSNGVGVTVSGSYGPVDFTGSYSSSASNSFLSSTASTEAERTATSYAKDVSERALKRVVEKVREQRSRTTIDEVVEINKHGFDNTDGTGHVTGLYHWLDKYYLSQVYNYGARMMCEFMVPEPAAFHIFSQLRKRSEGEILEKPIPLSENGLNNFHDLNESNYAQFTAMYGVNEVTPPPAQFTWINKAFNMDKQPNEDPYPWPVTVSSNDLEVPTGYAAKWARVKILKSHSGWVKVWIGHKYRSDSNQGNAILDNITGVVPFAIMSDYKNSYVISVEIECERSEDTLTNWKIKTFNAIKEAYDKLEEAYEDQLANLKFQAEANLDGQNPARNREIEKEELKRAAIELFTGQKYEAFDAMKDNQPSQHYPQFSNNEAIAEGDYVKFFEHAFEWHHMVYVFYPYFWGRKKNWITVRNYEDTDPVFTKFLQAGYARVLVPVRPAYLRPILYYIDTGQIWMGGDAPTIDDELYLSIINEIQEKEDQSTGEPVGEPWTVKVPTNLVMLQQQVPPVLPDFSEELLPEE